MGLGRRSILSSCTDLMVQKYFRPGLFRVWFTGQGWPTDYLSSEYRNREDTFVAD